MIYTGTAPASMYADYLLDLNVRSQDSNANTTTLNYRIYLKSKGGGYPHSSSTHKLDLTADGKTIVNTSVSYKVPAGGEFTLASGTFTVVHNVDGTKSFNFASAFASYHGSCSVSGSMTLPSIVRGGDLSITNPSGTVISSADIGTTIRLSVNNTSSNYTYRMGYDLVTDYGSVSSQISTNTITDYTLPTSWIENYFSNSSSKVVTFYVKTFNGTTMLTEDRKTLTVRVPSNIVPSVTNVVISENNQAVIPVFGSNFRQTLSKFRVTITASGATGSTISNYHAELDGQFKSSKTNEVLLDSTNKSGSLTVKVTVTDSRGRTATRNQNITVYPYALPNIFSFTATRDSNGLTANAFLKASHTSSGSPDNNAANIIVRIKKTTEDAWTTIYSATSNVDLFNETILLGSNLEAYDGYDLEATISDKFSSNKAVYTLPTSEITMAFHSYHNNVGIGVMPDLLGRNGLEVLGMIQSHSVILSESSIKLPGKLISSVDIDTIVNAGFYSVRNSTGLPSSSDKYGSLIVTKGDTTDDYKSFTDTIQTYLDGTDIYIRNSIDRSSGWSPWKKIGDRHTVTKYSNGYTIKHQDGYMEQVITADLTSAEKDFTSGSTGFYGAKTIILYFNDVFVSTPECVGNCNSSGYVQGFVGEAYTNRVNVRLYSPNSVAASNLSIAKVIVHAKGFWK